MVSPFSGDAESPSSKFTSFEGHIFKNWAILIIFFFKQKTAYEIASCLVGSEMCIRDSHDSDLQTKFQPIWINIVSFKGICIWQFFAYLSKSLTYNQVKKFGSISFLNNT